MKGASIFCSPTYSTSFQSILTRSRSTSTLCSRPSRHPKATFHLNIDCKLSLNVRRCLRAHLTVQRLSFLFNAIPRNSALRLTVYDTLVRQASSHDKVELLQITPESIERWTSEWNIVLEQKFDLLRLLAEAFGKAGQLYAFSPAVLYPSLLTSLSSRRTTSYQYLLASLRNLPPNSPHAKSSAIQAISTSLNLPSVFDFDTLFKINAITELQGHELFSLLRVFLSGGLEDYKKWESKYSGSIEKHGSYPLLSGFVELNVDVRTSIRTRQDANGTEDPVIDASVSRIPEHRQGRSVRHPCIGPAGRPVRGREMGD